MSFLFDYLKHCEGFVIPLESFVFYELGDWGHKNAVKVETTKPRKVTSLAKNFHLSRFP